jgi:c-di-GMP-related signal transduction protein
MPDQPILLARQPIYDASLNVVAFELLYRAISPDAAEMRNGDEASSRVLLSAFGGAGIMDITDGKPAYINFTKHLIINPPPVDPQHLVIEVLEDVLVTPELLDSVRRLRAQGYRIALDDFQHHPSLEPLVELADIVKLDVLELGEVKLRAEVRQLRNYPVRLLAEKIESWEMYNQCVDLGFSFFQGFFLARPQLLHGRRSAPARPAIAALMAQLADPDIGIPELTTTVSADPVLSFNLIRLVNSPMYRRAQPIESVREAIFALGVERVRGWCYLVALAAHRRQASGAHAHRDAPGPLLRTARRDRDRRRSRALLHRRDPVHTRCVHGRGARRTAREPGAQRRNARGAARARGLHGCRAGYGTRLRDRVMGAGAVEHARRARHRPARRRARLPGQPALGE